MIRLLNTGDYDAWIELAREVEPLFGPMADSPAFQEGIKNCILSHDAYGIENEEKELAGIIALDRANNEILWLAVKSELRGKKFGGKLVQKALEELGPGGDIYVRTFTGDISEGRAARAVYAGNGFTDLEEAGENPAGIETVIMVRKAI